MKVIKKITQSVDWDLVQIVFIVGTIPTMIVVGAIFPALFTPNYG